MYHDFSLPLHAQSSWHLKTRWLEKKLRNRSHVFLYHRYVDFLALGRNSVDSEVWRQLGLPARPRLVFLPAGSCR